MLVVIIHRVLGEEMHGKLNLVYFSKFSFHHVLLEMFICNRVDHFEFSIILFLYVLIFLMETFII